MKYAVIKTGGKQYKVQEGEEILIDKIEGEKGEKVRFKDVLLIVNGQTVEIGTPNTSKAEIFGEIVEHKKGEKIRVAKFKAKSRYRRVRGFRPFLTKVKIKKIVRGKGKNADIS